MKHPAFVIFKREIHAYFASPLAYIFIACFVALSVLFAFQIGQLFEFNEASLYSFFQFHPYLYVIFIPALGMRIFAEENKSGTIEILLSLPVSSFNIILGKFLAGLLICALALVLTFPLWIAINFLGPVDNFIAFGGYIASIGLAAIFLIITMAISILTNAQIIAFILSAIINFAFLAAGLPIIGNSIYAIFQTIGIGEMARGFLNSFALLNHFDNMVRGWFGLDGLYLFAILIIGGLWLNLILLKNKRRGQI